MPGRFACPECGAVPTPADDTPSGKKTRCRKCGTVFPAPVEDDADAEERPSRPSRPVRRRRKQQAGSGALVLILLIAVPLGVLFMAGAAALAWRFWPQPNNAPIAKAPAALPRVPRIGETPPPGRPGPIGGQPRAGGQFPAGGQAGEGTEEGMKAREIEGEDIDGKRFKLSDYRGKVVLLDFWGNW
jgi:hypothetical protein